MRKRFEMMKGLNEEKKMKRKTIGRRKLFKKYLNRLKRQRKMPNADNNFMMKILFMLKCKGKKIR